MFIVPRPSLLVPFGYGQQYRRLDWIAIWLLAHHHPEYVRRVVTWFAYKNGEIGPGGGWRATGMQPDRQGFAPEGQSFHQDQIYADGFVGAAALDIVARDGPDADFSHDGVQWSMVLPQWSAEAERWGLHCNISSEAWHLQPIEIDGWRSWRNNGRPAPRPNYPIPTIPDLLTPPEDDDMFTDTDRSKLDRVLALLQVHTDNSGSPPQTIDPTTLDVPSGNPSINVNATDSTTNGRVTQLQLVIGATPTGVFSQADANMVREIQKNLGLFVDGSYGPKTEVALRAWRKTQGWPR